MNAALKDGGRGFAGGSGGRFRKIVVAAEIAIALVLLIGAGLLMRSFLKLRAIDPGFDSRNVMTMIVSLAGRPEYVGPEPRGFVSDDSGTGTSACRECAWPA